LKNSENQKSENEKLKNPENPGKSKIPKIKIGK